MPRFGRNILVLGLAWTSLLSAQNVNWHNQITNKPFLDVKSYGVTGNGTTDDATKFQTALTAATGKTLLVQAGTYKLGALLTVPANTSIECNSGATLKRGYAGAMLSLGTGSSIKGCTFDGTWATYTIQNYTASLIRLNNVTDVSIIHNEFINVGGQSIYIYGGTKRVIISNNIFTNIDFAAIRALESSSLVTISNNIIDSSASRVATISDYELISIKVQGSSGGIMELYNITGNVITGPNNAGYMCIETGVDAAGTSTARSAAIVGNTCKLSTTAFAAFSVVGEYNVVSGNMVDARVSTMVDYAIELVFGENSSVSGNTVITSDTNAGTGIILNKMRNCTVVGNSLHGGFNYGIYLYAEASLGAKAWAGNNSVSGNTVNLRRAASSAINILCNASGTVCDYNIISNNILTGLGVGSSQNAIALGGASGASLDSTLIANNQIHDFAYGLNQDARALATRSYNNEFVAVTTPYAGTVTDVLATGPANDAHGGFAFKPPQYTYATLPSIAATDTRVVYCTNCTIAACGTGGTGAWAFAAAGAWKCPF
jgi:hypothetical protein